MALIARRLQGCLCEAEVVDTGHTVLGDELEALGGENKGQNPFAPLMRSLEIAHDA